MSKFYDKPSSDLLYQALLEIKDLEECRRFLQDLCTVSELKAMEQRMEVAMLLDQGLIYSDILERTGRLQRHHQPGEPLSALWGGRLPHHPPPSEGAA